MDIIKKCDMNRDEQCEHFVYLAYVFLIKIFEI